MKRYPMFVLFFSALFLFVISLIFPSVTQNAMAEGLSFCGRVLIPSLFPGFVLSRLLITVDPFRKKTRKTLFSVCFSLPSHAARSFWIGLLAGFPSAAEDTAEQYRQGRLSRGAAERTLAFTNNAGIVFVIGAVGAGIFGSVRIGVLLWIAQTLSALTVGILLADPRKNDLSVPSAHVSAPSLQSALPTAVISAVSAVLNVCGFVLFFRVVLAVAAMFPLRSVLRAALAGGLEMTCGLSLLHTNAPASVLAAAAMLGWSGCSVHLQICSVLSDTDLSAFVYLCGKFFTALLSPLFAAALLKDDAASVFSFAARIAAVVIVLFAVLYRVRKEYLYGKQNFHRRKHPPKASDRVY